MAIADCFQLAFSCASGYFRGMGTALPRSRSCFVCGVSNPRGLNLGFETDGAIVTGRFRLLPEHAGFQNTVHGGIIATVLDEAMVWACGVAAGRFTYCAELTVRYRKTLAPGQDVRLVGRLTANRKNRLFEAQAELINSEGEVLASGAGKYLPVPDELAMEMQSDFVSDLGVVLKR